jgi:hypothetical protein
MVAGAVEDADLAVEWKPPEIRNTTDKRNDKEDRCIEKLHSGPSAHATAKGVDP